jgi:hypothetical protein
LPNIHYLNLIQQYLPKPASYNQTTIAAAAAAPATRVTIHSESKSYESFDAFTALNYTVRLDSPLHEVWTDLMTADVAILSQSTFSYVPQLIQNAYTTERALSRPHSLSQAHVGRSVDDRLG